MRFEYRVRNDEKTRAWVRFFVVRADYHETTTARRKAAKFPEIRCNILQCQPVVVTCCAVPLSCFETIAADWLGCSTQSEEDLGIGRGVRKTRTLVELVIRKEALGDLADQPINQASVDHKPGEFVGADDVDPCVVGDSLARVINVKHPIVLIEVVQLRDILSKPRTRTGVSSACRRALARTYSRRRASRGRSAPAVARSNPHKSGRDN